MALPLMPLSLITIATFFYFLFSNRQVLKRLKQKILWFFIIAIVVVQTFFLGDNTDALFGVSYSVEQLTIGLRIALRAVLIMLAVSYLISLARGNSYRSFLERFGLLSFEGVFQVSQTFFPVIKSSLKKLLDAFKLENSSKYSIKRPIDSIAIFLADIIKNVENIDISNISDVNKNKDIQNEDNNNIR